MYRFENYLAFLLILPLIYLFAVRHKKGAVEIPSTKTIDAKGKRYIRAYIGKTLLCLGFLLGIVALARPQYQDEGKKVKKDGIDIVLTLDISRSMLANDIKPNRLAAAKGVITEFVQGRINDRLALVVFAGNAYTRVPLTFDHSVILESIKDLGVGDISNNGATAIGLGAGVSLNRLKKSNSSSKVIVLLTDGKNNAGELSPINSAQLANNLGVKLYTIGIGGEYVEVDTLFGKRKVENTEIDEELLKDMAQMTGAKYFRATDNNELEDIFDEIDRLEKSQIEGREIQKVEELYRPFLFSSLILILLGLYFERIKFIKIP